MIQCLANNNIWVPTTIQCLHNNNKWVLMIQLLDNKEWGMIRWDNKCHISNKILWECKKILLIKIIINNNNKSNNSKICNGNFEK